MTLSVLFLETSREGLGTTRSKEEGENMADNLQRIRNQLIQGLSKILWQLNVENLENNRLDSLQFRVDWIYGRVVRYQGLEVIDDRVVIFLFSAMYTAFGIKEVLYVAEIPDGGPQTTPESSRCLLPTCCPYIEIKPLKNKNFIAT